MPGKYDFSDTFERDKFDGKFVGKGELHYIYNRLCKLQSHNVFNFFLIVFYFIMMVRLWIRLVWKAVQIQSSQERKI